MVTQFKLCFYTLIDDQASLYLNEATLLTEKKKKKIKLFGLSSESHTMFIKAMVDVNEELD